MACYLIVEAKTSSSSVSRPQFAMGITKLRHTFEIVSLSDTPQSLSHGWRARAAQASYCTKCGLTSSRQFTSPDSPIDKELPEAATKLAHSSDDHIQAGGRVDVQTCIASELIRRAATSAVSEPGKPAPSIDRHAQFQKDSTQRTPCRQQQMASRRRGWPSPPPGTADRSLQRISGMPRYGL